MGPEVIELLAAPLALIGLGSAVLIGMKMRYTHIQRTRMGSVAQQDVDRLTESVDTLSAQVGLLRDQFLELNERVEFTERLLERPRSEGGDPGVSSGPKS